MREAINTTCFNDNNKAKERKNTSSVVYSSGFFLPLLGIVPSDKLRCRKEELERGCFERVRGEVSIASREKERKRESEREREYVFSGRTRQQNANMTPKTICTERMDDPTAVKELFLVVRGEADEKVLRRRKWFLGDDDGEAGERPVTDETSEDCDRTEAKELTSLASPDKSTNVVAEKRELASDSGRESSLWPSSGPQKEISSVI